MHAEGRHQQAYLLQLFSGEPLTMPSTAAEPGLKKFSLKNFKKCGRFLIRLLLTSFSFSFIWLSSSMFVAFDFDLNAVAGGVAALVNADELRQALCVPNNPIMSNSCEIESDRCRLWLSWFVCVAFTLWERLNKKDVKQHQAMAWPLSICIKLCLTSLTNVPTVLMTTWAALFPQSPALTLRDPRGELLNH